MVAVLRRSLCLAAAPCLPLSLSWPLPVCVSASASACTASALLSGPAAATARSDRDAAREIFDKEKLPFFEVYVKVSFCLVGG